MEHLKSNTFPSRAFVPFFVVVVLSFHACSEPINTDLTSRAPRGSTLNRDGSLKGNDHSGCEGKASAKNTGKLRLSESEDESSGKSERCVGEGDGSQGRGGTGTATGKSVEVSRPSGTAPSGAGSSTGTGARMGTDPSLNLGAQLYADNCQRCHSPAATYRLSEDPQIIRQAIRSVPRMQSISLTDEQLRIMTDYLKSF